MALRTIDALLRILRAAGPTNHPHKEEPQAQRLGEAYTAMVRAVADYIDACRAHHSRGYSAGVATLLGVVQTLPAPPIASRADLADLEEMETIPDRPLGRP